MSFSFRRLRSTLKLGCRQFGQGLILRAPRPAIALGARSSGFWCCNCCTLNCCSQRSISSWSKRTHDVESLHAQQFNSGRKLLYREVELKRKKKYSSYSTVSYSYFQNQPNFSPGKTSQKHHCTIGSRVLSNQIQDIQDVNYLPEMLIASNRTATFEAKEIPTVGASHLIATLRFLNSNSAARTLLCFFVDILHVPHFINQLLFLSQGLFSHKSSFLPTLQFVHNN